MNSLILIVFGTIIPETTSHQITVQLPPHSSSVSALPGVCRTNKILHFYPVLCHYLI